ncbi:MAG: hypothetical protein DWQ05_05730 [Calditrichaeota bacterium]|nr:MAG: hypothetical protein DWQ05_05730 [Calditrichota bacterium]
MKNNKFQIMRRLIIVGMASIALLFAACNVNSPMNPNQDQQSIETVAVDNVLGKSKTAEKASKKSENKGKVYDYPQFASRKLAYDQVEKHYAGGSMKAKNGASFKLQGGALTPPAGTPDGASVTIEMLIEKDEKTKELIFTFGPHGSQFNPPAEVWIDYSEIGNNGVNLYYISDDGNYIEQEPEAIDRKNKKMMLLIPHFSRYAIAHSR